MLNYLSEDLQYLVWKMYFSEHVLNVLTTMIIVKPLTLKVYAHNYDGIRIEAGLCGLAFV